MNKDRLIALCHKISNEKQVDFNVVLTYYFLETILAKIASSPYSHNFVFKGGFLYPILLVLKVEQLLIWILF